MWPLRITLVLHVPSLCECPTSEAGSGVCSHEGTSEGNQLEIRTYSYECVPSEKQGTSLLIPGGETPWTHNGIMLLV